MHRLCRLYRYAQSRGESLHDEANAAEREIAPPHFEATLRLHRAMEPLT
jgi:hypothetical protein